MSPSKGSLVCCSGTGKRQIVANVIVSHGIFMCVIHKYIPTYIRIHTYIYVCIYAYMYVHTYNIQTHMHVNGGLVSCIHDEAPEPFAKLVCVCVCVNICMYTCTYMFDACPFA